MSWGKHIMKMVIVVNLTGWALDCATRLQHFHKLQGKDLSHWQAFNHIHMI
jgi:hypothetical protein